MRRRGLWLGFGGVVLVGLAVLAVRPVRWALLQRALEARHPNVAWISTDQLAAELGRDTPPTLLDVRQPDEVAISQIPGAIPVSPDASIDDLGQLDLDGPVVVYCSVGARSGALAERLVAAGVDSVRNLRGSIFAWANEGRPLVRGGESVSTVHPYDAAWGTYLKPSRRAELAE